MKQVSKFSCTACGRKLPEGRWIIGKNRALAGGKIPRYCYPGEGCFKTQKGTS